MPNQGWVIALPRPSQFREIRESDGAVLQVDNTSPLSRYAVKFRSGNWDRAKPQYLEPTPYILDHLVIHYSNGLCVSRAGGNLRYYEGSFQIDVPQGEFHVDEGDRLLNEALMDALTKLKDQKFNAGVAMAEADGLARMGKDIMDNVSDVRRALRSKDYKRAYDNFRKRNAFQSWEEFRKKYSRSLDRSEKLSALPKSWLYYHFGYKPTVQDMANAQEDWFRRHAVPGDNNFRGSVMGSAKFIVNKEFEGPLTAPRAELMIMRDRQSTRVFLTVQLKDAFHARLAQMGATNVPEAAWNAVPYSWLVDYFVSVGDWLSVLDAGLGYSFGATVRSYRRETTVTCDRFGFAAPEKAVAIQASPMRMRAFTLRRTVNQQLYPPMFDVLPKLKLKGASLTQYANSLSALSRLF